MSKTFAPCKLSVVAVPIGNVADLSPRARETLQAAQQIFCEDTRKAGELFARAELNIQARITPLPGTREQEMDWRKEFSQAEGENWVLISDAGTPLVNDPGSHILAACHQYGIPVQAIPGPCAPITAWQWSGAFGLPFLFAGFAPKAKSKDNQVLEDFFRLAQNSTGTFCFFDSKHQIEVTLEFLAAHPVFQNALLHIAREVTKVHEELLRGTPASCLQDLSARLKADQPIGELTCLLQATPQENIATTASLDFGKLKEFRTAPPRKAAKILAAMTGKSVNECYQLLQD